MTGIFTRTYRGYLIGDGRNILVEEVADVVKLRPRIGEVLTGMTEEGVVVPEKLFLRVTSTRKLLGIQVGREVKVGGGIFT